MPLHLYVVRTSCTLWTVLLSHRFCCHIAGIGYVYGRKFYCNCEYYNLPQRMLGEEINFCERFFAGEESFLAGIRVARMCVVVEESYL